MNLSNYLVQRPPSNIYYVRWMVPVHARRAIGRSEFIKSLGTRDRRQAGKLALPILTGWRAAVDRAAAPNFEAHATALDTERLPTISSKLALTPFDLQQLAVTAGYENVGKRVEELIESKAKSGTEALNDLAKKLDDRRTEYNRMLIARDLSLWGGTATNVLEKRGLTLAEGSPEFEQFAMNVGRAIIDAHAKGLTSESSSGVISPFLSNQSGEKIAGLNLPKHTIEARSRPVSSATRRHPQKANSAAHIQCP